MLKGFKEFLLRGNVVELATAVIIGAAFTAIVTAFTDNIIGPLLAAIPTGSDCGQTMTTGDGAEQAAAVQVCGLATNIVEGDAATRMDFGAVIAAGINFVIVAAVIYFLIIVPYNKLTELRTLNKEEEKDATETELDLLTEIRDALTGGKPVSPEATAVFGAAGGAAAGAGLAVDAPPAPRPDPLNDPLPPRQAQGPIDPLGPRPQGPEGYVPPQGQGFVPPQGPGYDPGNIPPAQYNPGQYPPPEGPLDGPFDGPEGPRHSR